MGPSWEVACELGLWELDREGLGSKAEEEKGDGLGVMRLSGHSARSGRVTLENVVGESELGIQSWIWEGGEGTGSVGST